MRTSISYTDVFIFFLLFWTWAMVMAFALVEDRSFYLLWRLYSFWKGLS